LCGKWNSWILILSMARFTCMIFRIPAKTQSPEPLSLQHGK
jgi:hypothetical protein